MKSRLCLRVAMVSSIALVTGCSSLFGPEGYFRDRADNYLKADVLPPMQVPENIQTTNVEQLYVIPEGSEIDAIVGDSFVTPRPMALADSALDERVKVQSIGDRRWVLINASPAEVWPQVRAFLESHQLNVIYTNARDGILETSWLKFLDNEETKDKYRIKIESGIQPQTTEIHVLHMSMPWGLPGNGQVNWPSRSISSEREAWMVEELSTSLAESGGNSQSASLLAQTIGVADRVKLSSASDSEPVLHLDLDYSRAWATIVHALKQDGFTTWDKDKELGLLYSGYNVQEKEIVLAEGQKKGLMGGIFDFSDGFIFKGNAVAEDEPEDKPKTSFNLQDLLQNLQFEDTESNRKLFGSMTIGTGEPLYNVPGYLVVMRGWDNEIQVRVRSAQGQVLQPQEAKKLLMLIRNNLI